MQFVMAAKEGRLRPGILLSSRVVFLSDLLREEILDLPKFLSETPDAIKKTLEALGNTHTLSPRNEAESSRLEETRLYPPVLRPGKIVCIGQNYKGHLAEQSLKPHKFPVIFAKWPSCIIGQNEAVVLPKASKKVDIEAELAVVIAKKAKNVPKERALEYVFGYSILNDVSARDVQHAETQWVRGKSFDTFAPFGPWIVTADEIPDPSGLGIRSWINDTLMQEASTADMAFGVPEIIAYLSECFTLEPGDVIATGTPGGVGHFRNPPVYLKPGDRIRIEIERIGTLENPVRSED